MERAPARLHMTITTFSIASSSHSMHDLVKRVFAVCAPLLLSLNSAHATLSNTFHFPLWTDCMKVEMPIKHKHETKQWDHTAAVDQTHE